MDVTQKKLNAFVFLVPCIVYVLILRIVPLIYTVYLSFTSFNYLRQQKPVFVGFEQYRLLMQNLSFLQSLKLTFMFTGIAVGIELLLGLALAVLFDRPIRLKGVLVGIMLIPMILAPAVVGTIWHILYKPSIGPLNYFLGLLGIPQPQWINVVSTALLSIIIADVWEWTPFMFLILLSGLQVIPLQLREAAKIDGAGVFKIFRHITLPLLVGVILVVVVLRSMDAFKVFDLVYILTRGGPGTATEVVSIHLYKAAFLSFRMGRAASMVVVLLVVISLMYSAYLKEIEL